MGQFLGRKYKKMNKGEKNELTFQSPDRVLDELEKKSQNAPKARKIALILEDSKFDLEKITMYLKMSDSEVHIVSKRTIFDAKKYVFFERIRNPDAKILVLADFYLEKNELGTDLLKACQSISSKDIRLCLMSNSSINKVALKKIESKKIAL